MCPATFWDLQQTQFRPEQVPTKTAEFSWDDLPAFLILEVVSFNVNQGIIDPLEVFAASYIIQRPGQLLIKDMLPTISIQATTRVERSVI